MLDVLYWDSSVSKWWMIFDRLKNNFCDIIFISLLISFFQLVSLPFHGAQTFKSCQYWIPALDTPDPATPRSTKYFLRMSSQRIFTELKEELENCRYAVLLRWSDMSVIVGRGWRVSLISNYAHKCNAHILQAQSSVGFIIYLSTELKTRYLHSSIVQTRTN